MVNPVRMDLQSDNFMKFLLIFVGLGGALLLPLVLTPVDAYSTIIVEPVEGSRIPGCQDEAGCFTPNDIRTKVGSLVIFKNTDETAHSFTSNKFNSQLMINDGQEFSWIVEQGKVEYSCLLHPWAVGSITGLYAPSLNTFNAPPEWTLNLFNWYDDDVIDYDTFMNAIIYLMSYDILTEYIEPEPEPEVRRTSVDPDCDNAKSTTLRKQLGCDVPREDDRTLEEKCEDAYSNQVRKELGCS